VTAVYKETSIESTNGDIRNASSINDKAMIMKLNLSQKKLPNMLQEQTELVVFASQKKPEGAAPH
jgi:hypothetical protein